MINGLPGKNHPKIYHRYSKFNTTVEHVYSQQTYIPSRAFRIRDKLRVKRLNRNVTINFRGIIIHKTYKFCSVIIIVIVMGDLL